MRIVILGLDGYIGYPLTLDLLTQGHEVVGLDNGSRRARAQDSLTPIETLNERDTHLRNFPNYRGFCLMSLGRAHPSYLRNFLAEEKPDVIIHLAEQPSAAWSMIDPFYASDTQFENVIGTLHLLWAMKEECPEAHLIKLGTMGEYGTPNCDIPEGFIPSKPCAWTADMAGGSLIRACPMRGLPFPKLAGSFYHLSKVHDTNNIHFSCRTWGLRSTDIMQGVVFGLNDFVNEVEITRFDYDQYFGTVINRFCAQAISNHPLTIYGYGGQIRGYLPLKDSIQCLNLIIDNPPSEGEYRIFNQFENIYSVNDLANEVQQAALMLGIEVGLAYLNNPREVVELENHYYNPDHQKLFDLGYEPTKDIRAEIIKLINQLMPYRKAVKPSVIIPTTTWR